MTVNKITNPPSQKAVIDKINEVIDNLGGGGSAPVWGNITGTLSDQTDLQNALDAKQSTISDLSTIRSGASAGATALQPNDNISELVNNAGYISGITSSDVTTALGYTPENASNKVTSLSSSSTDTQYPSAKCVFDFVGGKADDSAVIKKDGGSSQQTISLSSGTGTTALGVKSRSTSSYISFNNSSGWIGSYGVSSDKKPVFYNGTGYTLAKTSDIPTIATSVSSSSTNAEVVGAKLFYDTCGDIETLINAL